MRSLQGVLVCSLCLLVLVSGCRRNTPDLVDTNQAPDTELWYAPPDSSEYEYLVHMYWRGRDNDGTVDRYIWTIQDTLVVGETSWNPATRLRDLRSGRVITKTDSIFSFTAYKNVGGVGVKKNRQAFYIAAIDNDGVIDPTPAAIEFVATIDKLPRMVFAIHLKGNVDAYQPLPVPKDTVGMARPFAISYHGLTTNGKVEAYQWFPLSTTITLPGARVWTDDLSDTLRTFSNVGAGRIPSGVFRFAAKCRDDANAESAVDAGKFTQGVSQVVVNFDPDTEIDRVKNTSFKGNPPVKIERDINFTDAAPDTVPYLSWVWLHYSAHDDPRDSIRCKPLNQDRCIDFQIGYSTRSGVLEWYPRGGVHDSDTLSASDSNSVNAGPLTYDFYVRGLDENARPDGTPPSVHIVGNYAPTLDSLNVYDYRGYQLDPTVVDTVTWDFWHPANTDTIDTSDISNIRFRKRFSWTIHARGHDDKRDPDGSGVKAWQYYIFDQNNNFLEIANSGETFFSGSTLNVLNDKFELTFRYPITDPAGDTVFNRLPPYINSRLRVVLRGRDTKIGDIDFVQYFFLSVVPAGQKGLQGQSDKVPINQIGPAAYGRTTQTKEVSFYFRMTR